MRTCSVSLGKRSVYQPIDIPRQVSRTGTLCQSYTRMTNIMEVFKENGDERRYDLPVGLWESTTGMVLREMAMERVGRQAVDRSWVPSDAFTEQARRSPLTGVGTMGLDFRHKHLGEAPSRSDDPPLRAPFIARQSF